MPPSSDKDPEKNEVPPGKVNFFPPNKIFHHFIPAMAGAMMVERAGSIPTMEPTMNYKEFVAKLEEEQNREMDEEQLREMEASALDIGQKMREEGKAKELGNLIKQIRPFLKLLSKAKAAKLIRGLVDMYLDMGADAGYFNCPTHVRENDDPLSQVRRDSLQGVHHVGHRGEENLPETGSRGAPHWTLL